MMHRNLLFIIVSVFLTLPAEAQFRGEVPSEFPKTRLYDTSNKVGAFLNRIFNPSVFQMSHSFEMTTGSFGGNGYSMGMYTNTMAWQFSSKLAARMDVAVAYSPQNQIARNSGFAQQAPQVFLRNAEVTWKPSERVQLNFQVRQDPYAYRGMMGYGYYGYRHPGYFGRNY
ncbi:MAG: hypothetical protein OXE92_00700 [Bacteroidetes bacterium]|nr:hypothetical protein [Bacteroidota bacterium]MCY4204228.1 hypothetical protein [Bacteroidota bacterium]